MSSVSDNHILELYRIYRRRNISIYITNVIFSTRSLCDDFPVQTRSIEKLGVNSAINIISLITFLSLTQFSSTLISSSTTPWIDDTFRNLPLLNAPSSYPLPCSTSSYYFWTFSTHIFPRISSISKPRILSLIIHSSCSLCHRTIYLCILTFFSRLINLSSFSGIYTVFTL